MHRIQLTILVFELAFFAAILWMVWMHKLKLKYAVLWSLPLFAIVAVTIVPGLIDWISRITGLYYITALLLLSFGFLLALILYFSSIVSRVVYQNRLLGERLAFLEKRVLELEQAALPRGSE